jgi:hypothetical protein
MPELMQKLRLSLVKQLQGKSEDEFDVAVILEDFDLVVWRVCSRR